jgi:transposase
MSYAAVRVQNEVVSASGSPRWARCPTQATYPSGRINTPVGADRAAFADGGAAVSVSGAQAGAGPPRVGGHSVRVENGHPVGALPHEIGCGSGMTCWRRLRDWNEAGVWDRLHQVLLDELQDAEQLDGSRAVVDSSHVRVKGGRKDRPLADRPSPGRAPSTTRSAMARAFLWPRRSRPLTAPTSTSSSRSWTGCRRLGMASSAPRRYSPTRQPAPGPPLRHPRSIPHDRLRAHMPATPATVIVVRRS